jgi:taurine--2-oxoglutarate transaminase
VFAGGLTYNSHPLGCAAALATIGVYEEDRLVERARQMGAVMATRLADLAARHPSVGAVRSIGLFGIVELIRNRQTREPMAPFNASSPEMAALGSVLPAGGPVYVRAMEFVLHEPAPLHQREQLREGFAIIDRGLAIADAAVT